MSPVGVTSRGLTRIAVSAGKLASHFKNKRLGCKRPLYQEDIEMLSIKPGALFLSISHLKMIDQSMSQAAFGSQAMTFPTDALMATQRELEILIDACNKIGLPVSKGGADSLQHYISHLLRHPRKQVSSPLNHEIKQEVVLLAALECNVLSNLAGDTVRRFTDELGLRQWLQLDQSMVQLYEQDTPLFGGEVAANFPSVAYEIEQGGKALALGLSTAAVFHFLRCLESAIRALSRCLSIPDPTTGAERNWSAMLNKLRTEVENRWPRSSGRMSGDSRLFDELLAALGSMANPWRNATMHLDQKYTEEEARRIMAAVHGLMDKIAKRMDEDGLPKA